MLASWPSRRPLTGRARIDPKLRSNCLQPSQTHQLVKLPPQPITNVGGNFRPCGNVSCGSAVR